MPWLTVRDAVPELTSHHVPLGSQDRPDASSKMLGSVRLTMQGWKASKLAGQRASDAINGSGAALARARVMTARDPSIASPTTMRPLEVWVSIENVYALVHTSA